MALGQAPRDSSRRSAHSSVLSRPGLVANRRNGHFSAVFCAFLVAVVVHRPRQLGTRVCTRQCTRACRVCTHQRQKTTAKARTNAKANGNQQAHRRHIFFLGVRHGSGLQTQRTERNLT
eukprot:3523474-Rhodomonas_salina.1